MKNQKYVWNRIVIYAMESIYLVVLVGCANNETSAPISKINSNGSTGNYRINADFYENIKLKQFYSTSNKNMKNVRDQVNISLQEKSLYKRNYKKIQKGSYCGTIYHVKHGDTLFYIAWITGNDYRDLAQKNNIQEPYFLSVGQTLQVENRIAPIINNRQMKDTSSSISTCANISTLATSISGTNTKILKSSDTFNKKRSDSKGFREKKLTNTLPPTYSDVLVTPHTVVTKSMPIVTSNTSIINWHWPTNGKIINNFSTEKGGNKGIDISGYRGQSICSAANGKVVYAGNALRGYGNLIIIKHNNDYLSAYAHNDKILVREQQEIIRGQKIATMGNTGTNITKLHFEIRYKGKPVNPLRYIRQE